MSRVSNRTPLKRRKRTAAPVRSKRQAAAGKGKYKKKTKPADQSRLAWRLGQNAAKNGSVQAEENELFELQKQWASDYCNLGIAPQSNSYMTAMKSYLAGYFSIKGRKAENWLLLPTDKTVGAVVMAMNEEQSLSAALKELERLPLYEIVVIVNGSTDNSLTKARTSGRAVVLHYGSPLGHDVGRAIGAKVSVSDIMLFVDADIPINAEQLLPFVRHASSDVDIALNDLSSFIGNFELRDEVTILKEFLNRAIFRPDLTINSLTAVPHALTRHAIDTIGPANLAVPPKAQAIALKSGLRVGIGGSVDVISRNRVRTTNTGSGNQMIQLIIGDHLEALGWAMGEKEPRLKYVDSIRARGS